MHSTTTVYTRPLPEPERSALRLTVKSPVISQSGDLLPSPKPFPGSLLVTEMILQVVSRSQLSNAETAMVTGTILWFGGQRAGGLAERLISGGVSSITVMSTVSGSESAMPSLTTRVMVVVPTGNRMVGLTPLAILPSQVHV